MPLIDWFTVIAQVINFLILVWLLKHFLYKPILNAIDAREKRVADELANANAKKAEAEKEKEEFKHKNEELDQQRNDLLNKAKDDAKAERQRLFEAVRKEASDLKAKQQEALENDEQNLRQEIGRRTQQEVFNIARKVLRDLAGTSLEERTVDVFDQRLRNLKDDEKKQLAAALSTPSGQVLIRSAFDLPEAQRDSLKKTIKDALGVEIQPEFKTSPDLISGIELTTDGQKVAWSIADYLSTLQKSVDELLKQPTSKAKTGPANKEAETRPETDYNKPKSRKEPEAAQKPEAEQESEAKQQSGTKSEPVANQETNPRPKST